VYRRAILFVLSAASIASADCPDDGATANAVHLMSADLLAMDSTSWVVTAQAYGRPPADASYALLDEEGLVATLSVTNVRGSGPHSVQLAIARWKRQPASRVEASNTHHVVVGPVDGDAECARLMFLGLARGGSLASRTPDAPGRSLPRDGPQYAVDLDGDRRADLVRYVRSTSGELRDHVIRSRGTGEVFRFRRRWRRTARARWHTEDLVGP